MQNQLPSPSCFVGLRRLVHGAALLCAAAQLSPAPLSGAIVAYDFTGQITTIEGPAVPAFNSLAIGDLVTGHFSYDDAGADQNASPFIGDYAALDYTLVLGGHTYNTSVHGIYVDHGGWGYTWAVAGADATPSTWASSAGFYDSSLPYLFSDDLLRPPPALGSVDIARGALTFFSHLEGQDSVARFDLTSFTRSGVPAAVPEPAGTTGVAALVLVLSVAFLQAGKRSRG